MKHYNCNYYLQYNEEVALQLADPVNTVTDKQTDKHTDKHNPAKFVSGGSSKQVENSTYYAP